MTTYDVLYEIGEEAAESDGGKLAEVFLKRFLEDVDGLPHTVGPISEDIQDWSVMATVETDARITEEWFNNADVAVEV